MDNEDEQLARALALSLQGIDPTSLMKSGGHSGGDVTSTEKQNPPPKTSSPDQRNEWFPNLERMQILLSMGISENAAKRGLYYTGDTSADQAAAWVFENLENPDLHKTFTPPQGASSSTPDYKALQASLDESRAFKMVFVVNMSLGMGVGKIAAQVGHATLAIYKTLLINVSEQVNVREWEGKGAKKIVLKGTNAEHLLALKQMAERQNIIHFMIQDAGKTQVPSGSITVLALFGKGYHIDEVTGQLSLL